MMMFKAQVAWVGNYFFKSAKGCKRLQVSAIDCKICRKNQAALARALGASFEAVLDD
jgi:hypothetical protein